MPHAGSDRRAVTSPGRRVTARRPASLSRMPAPARSGPLEIHAWLPPLFTWAPGTDRADPPECETCECARRGTSLRCTATGQQGTAARLPRKDGRFRGRLEPTVSGRNGCAGSGPSRTMPREHQPPGPEPPLVEPVRTYAPHHPMTRGAPPGAAPRHRPCPDLGAGSQGPRGRPHAPAEAARGPSPFPGILRGYGDTGARCDIHHPPAPGGPAVTAPPTMLMYVPHSTATPRLPPTATAFFTPDPDGVIP